MIDDLNKDNVQAWQKYDLGNVVTEIVSVQCVTSRDNT